jgi:hypothetical protein
MTVLARHRRGLGGLGSLLIGVVVAGAGAHELREHWPRGHEVPSTASVERTVGAVLLVLGLAGVAGAVGLLLARGPAVAFDDVGLELGGLAWQSPARVAWTEVAEFVHHGADEARRDRHELGILLADVDDYLARPDVGLLERLVIRVNARAGRSHLVVSGSTVVESIEDVVRALRAELARRRP